tara:strand:+ start:9600 stop:9854 length:255 start_codon:yes stop_codon:yes gene_type:complete
MKESESTEKLQREDTDWLLDIKKSRDITQEILRFGVNQEQIRNIINLLALELEDREMMLAINRAVKQEEDEERPKILHPGENNE